MCTARRHGDLLAVVFLDLDGFKAINDSLGVSVYPQSPDVDPDILLRQADIAMYQAKQRGKSQVRFFDGVRADAFDTRKIRAGNSERPA
ncbi:MULTISPECIES: diguanylate cyclase [unclassified Marinobacter]|uniref:diguanylate cyclase domain-containing protein n=1 Tax=Marinobacter sp. TaxID=50741 RepID=UPI0022284268|nr:MULTISPECIES: diguanylate cyclase [unclassified Marinobacter]